MKVRTSALAMFASGIVLFALPCVSSAQMLNGGFEDSGGSFDSWGTIGNTQILDDTLGTGPVEGSWQALLATATDGSINPDVVPGIGVGPALLEPFLGVNLGTILGVGKGTPLLGSAVTQSVDMWAGESVIFDFNFLTNQTFNDGTSSSIAPSTVNNDFAFMTVSPAGDPNQANIFVLVDTFVGYVDNPGAPGGFETGFTITDPANPFISETGFVTAAWTAPTAGEYLLGFGVVHVTTGPDNGVNSALLLDNTRLDAVPEPASLVVLGLLTLGIARRKKRATIR